MESQYEHKSEENAKPDKKGEAEYHTRTPSKHETPEPKVSATSSNEVLACCHAMSARVTCRLCVVAAAAPRRHRHHACTQQDDKPSPPTSPSKQPHQHAAEEPTYPPPAAKDDYKKANDSYKKGGDDYKKDGHASDDDYKQKSDDGYKKSGDDGDEKSAEHKDKDEDYGFTAHNKVCLQEVQRIYTTQPPTYPNPSEPSNFT